jgi:hypothetical protein
LVLLKISLSLSLSNKSESGSHHKTTHASSRGLVVGGIATSLRVPPVVRLGRLDA